MDSDEHMMGAFLFYLIYGSLRIFLLPIGISIGSFALGGFIAFLGGLAPDTIEPPTWPGHRGFFHYIVGPVSIIPAVVFLNATNIMIYSIGSFCLGYFSHFFLDIIG